MKSMMKGFASAMALTVGLTAHAQAADVEVLHWWTSGSEAAALNVLKETSRRRASAGKTCRSRAAAARRR